MDKKTVTRRDWFRLKKSHQNQLLTDTRQNSAASALQPVAHPTNHIGMDLNELPPLCEASLSREQVAQLFCDIEQLASDVVLMQRTTGARQATAAGGTSNDQLQLAMHAMLDQKISRLQIRYRWQDADWIDTLESNSKTASESTFRLIRISHTTRT